MDEHFRGFIPLPHGPFTSFYLTFWNAETLGHIIAIINGTIPVVNTCLLLYFDL